MKTTWDQVYMTMCYTMASRSGDRSSKIGAVIVAKDKSIVSVGYNDLPRGIDHEGEAVAGMPERRSPENGSKYMWTEHSERNAIYNAGRNGVPIKDCTLYVNLMPCADCARAIIQSGITEVVCHKQGHDAFYETRGEGENVWAEAHEMVTGMFLEAGVHFRWWSGVLVQPTAFFSGQEIQL